MSTTKRPWYCPDRAVDEYRTTLTTDGDNFSMLKKLKILRAIVVNVGVILLTAFLVAEGGDPTILGTLTLLILGGYNGLEMSDYLALLQAYKEVQQQRNE
jgi:hypothetical protein